MKKRFKFDHKSQIILECLIALGLFLAFSAGISTLAFQYVNSLKKSADLDFIKSTASENLEALQAMAYDNWSAISNGDYDLNPANNIWQLSPATAAFNCMYRCRQGQGQGKAVGFYKCSDRVNQKNKDCDVVIQYQKNVNVSSISRDAQCEITDHGTVDPDTKLVTLTFNWLKDGQVTTQTFTRYFTNWRGPTACLQSGYLANAIYVGDTINFDATAGFVTGDTRAFKTINMGNLSVNGTVSDHSTITMPTVNFDSYRAIADHVMTGNYAFTAGQTYSGIWYVAGDATINSNVTINGTIIASRHIIMESKSGIAVNPTGAYPALVAGENIRANRLAASTIQGIIYAYNDLQLEYASNVAITGSLLIVDDIIAKKGAGLSIVYDNDLLQNPPPYFSN